MRHIAKITGAFGTLRLCFGVRNHRHPLPALAIIRVWVAEREASWRVLAAEL
jgi:hypothetical protein